MNKHVLFAIQMSSYIWLNYLLFSVGLFFLYKKVLAPKLAHRKIFKDESTTKQHKMEAIHTLKTMIVFHVCGALTYILHKLELTQVYNQWDKWSYFYFVGSFFILHFLHDTYFYWTHRWMHEIKWLRKHHKVHHDSRIPTPMTAFSFSVVEAFIQGGFFILAALILPIHWFVLSYFFAFVYWISVWGHMEWEFWPNSLYRLPYASTFNTLTHHNMHHYYKTKNYGLYYRFWDELCGTLHKETYPHFYKIRKNINDHFGKKSELIRPEPNEVKGLYFEQQESMGEDVNIDFFCNNQRFKFHHGIHDGESALKTISKENEIEIERTNSYTPREKVNFLNILKSFLRWMSMQPYRPAKFVNEVENDFSNSSIISFSKEESLKIRFKANKHGVSALFLENISKVTSKYLQGQRQVWMVPVNMRKNEDERNAVSFIDLRTDGLTTRDIQSRIREEIKSGFIQVSDLSFKLLNQFLRFNFIPLVIAGNYTLRRTGVFSNLGSFKSNKDLNLAFNPPALKVAPLSIGLITVNGQMSLSIKTHKSVGLSEFTFKRMTKEIKDSLLQD